MIDYLLLDSYAFAGVKKHLETCKCRFADVFDVVVVHPKKYNQKKEIHRSNN